MLSDADRGAEDDQCRQEAEYRKPDTLVFVQYHSVQYALLRGQ